jgi:hypothetical protein
MYLFAYLTAKKQLIKQHEQKKEIIIIIIIIIIQFNSILYYLCAEPTAVRPIKELSTV